MNYSDILTGTGRFRNMMDIPVDTIQPFCDFHVYHKCECCDGLGFHAIQVDPSDALPPDLARAFEEAEIKIAVGFRKCDYCLGLGRVLMGCMN